jgi:hypothetical protein
VQRNTAPQTPNAQEATMARSNSAKSTAKSTPATEAAFTLTEKPGKVLASYLTVYADSAADAPHRGLPFIDAKDNVRVKPDHFEGWFTSVGNTEFATGTPGKRDVRAILKDAGLVQKVYALPTHEAHPELQGKSFGLYTGPAPAGTAKLPRRLVERKAPAAPKAAKATPASDGSEQVAASTLVVGDTIATSRKGLATGDTVAAITEGPGGRIQARNADGKMIRSFAPETTTWVRHAA